MPLYRLAEHAPQIAATTFVAAEATIIGRAALAEHVSIWPGAVVRADNEPINIGAGSNVQEGAVLHTDPGCPLQIGNNVTVGHQAMLHGCTVGDGALIGIQAVVLNNAVIGADSLVAAGALVTEGKTFPPRSLILGSPAKAVRELSDEEVRNLRANAQSYVERAALYRHELIRLD
ncbi:gamma carbonic anhydrase family protein [Ralstonia solanacearum]|uniref:gamma carbonic anhydrase family protein n=1 Tax=Ralstonia solanacearum TaxID=305 RepID=UPI001FFAB325|nr:gamma carbonic anhydrase family protein [Ralstonia solanacearum]MDB0507689.1 gamma carbonic anhydrase family protein [Ralstonia solanacearum]MDB0511959.1 gamma carbonic anhydrase family protein [Ralstonia solanacearum]